MKQRANGIDFEEVEEREGVQSISRHITFDEDTDDPEKIAKCVDILAESVHGNLIKNHYLFRTVTIIARMEDFTTYTRAKTVPIWTSDLELIKRTVMKLFSEFLGRKLRLVAVGVSKLRERDENRCLLLILLTNFIIVLTVSILNEREIGTLETQPGCPFNSS